MPEEHSKRRSIMLGMMDTLHRSKADVLHLERAAAYHKPYADALAKLAPQTSPPATSFLKSSLLGYAQAAEAYRPYTDAILSTRRLASSSLDASALGKIGRQFAVPTLPASMLGKISKALPSESLLQNSFRAVPDFGKFIRHSRVFENSIAHFAKANKALLDAWRQDELLDRAGWLPHASMPWAVISQESDPEILSSRLEIYYRDNWSTVSQNLADEVSAAQADAESFAIFKEALSAHGAGLYRMVCRSIFPDIERVARSRFSSDPFKGMASVRELRRQAGELPLTVLSSYKVYEKLERHVYEDVKSETSLARAKASPIPNRHAAIHGLITYSSFLNSINTIFLATYV